MRSVADANAESDITDSYGNMPAMAKSMPHSESTAQDMPVTENAENTDEPAFSGGGSSSAEGGSVPESVPAEVSIHNSDGSKMMFKKYLLTFIDGNNITDNGEDITITVDEEEYGNVMEHLRTNEYVKSVTEGTPSDDGKLTINIK